MGKPTHRKVVAYSEIERGRVIGMGKALHRILYVEDEADIQAIAKITLEAVGGFSVEVCSSGEEALRRGPASVPDLILLDVMMPGMDGPSTLLQLRKYPALAETQVIFMTAKVQPAEIAYFQSLGALDVIAKPFDPMSLSRQISEIWGRVYG